MQNQLNIKRCRTCKHTQNIENFQLTKKGKRLTYCKVCYLKKENKSKDRKCHQCNIIKTKENFNPYCRECNECRNILFNRKEKECKSCHKIKLIDNFRYCGKYKSGDCKNCEALHYKDRYCLNLQDSREKTRKWNKKSRKKNPENPLLHSAKSRAKRNNVIFTLNKNDISIPEFCPVLGIKLEKGDGLFCDSSPSIDKIIPELGYVKGMSWLLVIELIL